MARHFSLSVGLLDGRLSKPGIAFLFDMQSPCSCEGRPGRLKKATPPLPLSSATPDAPRNCTPADAPPHPPLPHHSPPPALPPPAPAAASPRRSEYNSAP